MITPIQKLQAVWDQGLRSPKSLHGILVDHLANPQSVVVSTPTLFVMARPVSIQSDLSKILGDVRTPEGSPDAWWIYGLAGNMSEALLAMPYYLPAIGFERRDEAHFWPTREFTAKLKRQGVSVSCNSGQLGRDFPELFPPFNL